MNRYSIAALMIVTGSLLASVIALLAGARSWAAWAAVPAAVVTGLVLLGHLITLDDDAPDGWSNPASSRDIWVSSLRALLVKALVFLAAISFAVWCRM